MGTDQINKILLMQLMLIWMLIAGSCTKRHLEELPAEGKVKLTFNWKKLLAGSSAPTKMKLYFYGNNGTVQSVDCGGTAFEGTLPTGTYQLLAYNTDGTQIQFKNQDSYANTQAYTPNLTRTTYINQPFFFYGTGVSELIVSSEQTDSLTIIPKPLSRLATMKFIIIGKVEHIESLQCVLSGLAQSIKIASGEAIGQDGTITFTPQSVPGTNDYQATIGFFGAIPPTINDLTVEINFADGSKGTMNLNISTALQHPDYSTIINTNVEIDIRGDIQTGFIAMIKDWNYTEENENVE